MEITLTIILIILFIVFWNKPKKNSNRTPEVDDNVHIINDEQELEHNLIEDIENKDDSSKPEEEVYYKSWEEIKEEEERENAILKKELDELVLFIWPEAKYKEPSNLPYCNTFALVMWECEYKKLYGMYEHLLSDYPKELTKTQQVWISEAIRILFDRASIEFLKNDDAIVEAYKYLSYPSHLQKALIENAREFPQLIAVIAGWSACQCDAQRLDSMLALYDGMEKNEQKEYIHQLVDFLDKRQEEIFKNTLPEIKTTTDMLESFIERISFEDLYDEKKGNNTILLLRQGYDEKQAIEEFEVFRKTLSNTPTYKQDTPKVITAKDGLDSVDIDRSLLLTRLGHVRWKYNYGSESDYTYIKRNIKSLTHIDWEDVDRLINGEDIRLATQMKLFKEAITSIKEYAVWNRIDKSCPNTVEVKYKYPYGQSGDINRGLALCYGVDQTEQVDALYWKVLIDPRKHYDIIDLMVDGQLGVINDPEENKRIQEEPAVMFLKKYNNYAKLRFITSSVITGEAITKGPYFSIASQIYSTYHHQLKEKRGQFYQELILTTGTSSRWKSEQQVYAVTRYEFPDAIYQYHTPWLGLQSLDVFIPSLSVGIEYQGLQHYEPVEIFGGEVKFKEVVERDKRKKRLCKENGVELIYWKYDEPINSERLRIKLNEVIPHGDN